MDCQRPTRVPPEGTYILSLRSLELLQSVIRDLALPLAIDDAVRAGQMAVGTNWTLVQVLHALTYSSNPTAFNHEERSFMKLKKNVYIVIHLDLFYSAYSSPLLRRSAPDTARILCLSFTLTTS